MFRTKLSLVIIGLIVVGICIGFADRNADIIRLSRKSGFYDRPFDLTIKTGKNLTLYYTTDGSDPDENAILYDGSIHIEDVSSDPNVYSLNDDIGVGFHLDDYEKFDASGDRAKIPDYLVDKCNVIRVAAYDDKGEKVAEKAASYFVGFRNKPAYEGLYVVSLISEPHGFFDSADGIYVMGDSFREFEQKMEKADVEEDLPQEFEQPRLWPANYHNKGKEWERRSYISIFDTKRREVLGSFAGVRIAGRGSRGYLPRSLGVFARDEYSGTADFNRGIFKSQVTPHKIKIFSGGDEYNSKIKDALVSNLCSGMEVAFMEYIPCALFLDGEYWGTYYISESFNKDYVGDHYNVSPDNVVMTKYKLLVEGDQPGDDELYNEMEYFIKNNDMSVPENYKEACEIIDIDSFIDYYAVMGYIARRRDWPRNNLGSWRSRTTDGSGYADGKWRWMLYDVNSSSFAEPEYDSIAYMTENDALFGALSENPEFRAAFNERSLYLSEHVFNPERVNDYLDKWYALMRVPIYESNKRFYGEEFADNYPLDDKIQALRNFFNERVNHVPLFTY